MIVKDIILTKKQRESFILLDNSPDPDENYLYSSELNLIMNKQTGTIMTYYWDDKPDGYEIPFDKAFKLLTKNEMPEKYYGKIKFIHNKYIIKSIKYTINFFDAGKRFKDLGSYGRYPTISILDLKGNTIYIHRIVGVLYLPNPENKPFINHKGVDKDYSCLFKKEDLNWATPKENSNVDKKKLILNHRYLEVDSNGSILNSNLYTYSELSVLLKDKYLKFKLKGEDIWRYKNRFFKRVDINILNYKKYIIDSGYLTEEQYEINDSIWKSKLVDGKLVYVNLNGVIKYNNKLFLGKPNSKGYRKVTIDKIDYVSHVLACFISSDMFSDFSDINLEVDHINSDPYCNLLSNLRFTTHKNNMNNENTLEKKKKRYKKIKQYDLTGKFIKEWDCVGDIAKYYGCDNDIICRTASRKYGPKRIHLNSLWCYSGDELKIEEDLVYVFYKFNKNGEVIESGRSPKDLEYDRNFKYYNYLNTGIPAPNGYYYQQGRDFLISSSGKVRIRLRDLL